MVFTNYNIEDENGLHLLILDLIAEQPGDDNRKVYLESVESYVNDLRNERDDMEETLEDVRDELSDLERKSEDDADHAQDKISELEEELEKLKEKQS